MTSAVIVSTARTPLAKSWKGSFNMTHGATLGGHAVEHAIQRAGIEAAKAKGVYKGRKKSIDRDAVSRLRSEGIGATEIARRLGIGRASVYKVLAAAS